MSRRLRGAAGTALVWGAAFAAAITPLAILIAMEANRLQIDLRISWLDAVMWVGMNVALMAALMGTWGAFSGLLFAALVSLLERRGNVEQVSLGRAAAYGAASVAALPVLTFLVSCMVLPAGSIELDTGPSALMMFPWLGGIGAACGAGSLWMARRAPAAGPLTAHVPRG